ncbi:MAG: hypothetical protein HZB56_05315 [Deltaproteobacteria bacterium]|nr:hypothetical protein [Deltaproteobacteria bacterium]
MKSKSSLPLPPLVVALAGLAAGACSDEPPPRSSWSGTAPMGASRAIFSMTQLPSGLVLVAGGRHDAVTFPAGSAPQWTTEALATAELYDPVTGIWTPTGSMSRGRYGHGAVLLPGGKVLVFGGADTVPHGTPGCLVYGDPPVPCYLFLDSAELYDPATGTWTPTRGSMATPHLYPGLLLTSGKVLVLGGIQVVGPTLRSAELYDPETDRFEPTGPMATGRAHPACALLDSGEVLVVGGLTTWDESEAGGSAELYDPVTGTWRPAASPGFRLAWNQAIRLRDGRVLVAGGVDPGQFGVSATDRASLYDPVADAWRGLPRMSHARGMQATTLLPSGRVLLVAGFEDGTEQGISAERFDPATGTWTESEAMPHHHGGGVQALVLGNGVVLVAGGLLDDGGFRTSVRSAELYREGP